MSKVDRSAIHLKKKGGNYDLCKANNHIYSKKFQTMKREKKINTKLTNTTKIKFLFLLQHANKTLKY